jgi:hypothetical protein
MNELARIAFVVVLGTLSWGPTVSLAQPSNDRVGQLRTTLATPTSLNVLFIDLNNAEDEADAIDAALPARGARLHVVPPTTRLSMRRRDVILKTKVEFDRLTRQAEHCTLVDAKTCPPIWDKLRALELERERLTGGYGISQLIEDLAPLSNTTMDVVVISGHHSRGFFRGEIAELEVSDLLKIDAALPQLFRRTRTVILLGCETGTPEMFGSVFPVIFPSASVLIGAEDNAPTRSELRNLSFIEAVIAAEPQLHAARDPQAVGRIHRRFLKHKWPATILWRGEHFFAKRWSGPIAEAAAGVLNAEIEAEDRKQTVKKRRRTHTTALSIQ